MPLLALPLQTVHTVSGFVTLASSSVALLEAARLYLRKRESATRPVFSDPEPEARVSVDELAVELEQEPAIAAVAAEASPEGVEAARVSLVCNGDLEPDEPASPVASFVVTASGVSDRGKKRRTNEDCLLLLHDHALFVVADGMGGYNGGEVASSLAVDAIREAFERKSFDADLRCDVPLPVRGRELAAALHEANRVVSDLASEQAELASMGTTLVAARFSATRQSVYIANVGDSRCYRFRAGKLAQLTTDHTLSQLGDRGPARNQLYRAIGVKPVVDIDILVDSAQPEDVYLLCSDGLPKMVSAADIAAALASQPDLELAAHDLVERANDAGGSDNVTVVLMRVRERGAAAYQPGAVGHPTTRQAHEPARRAAEGTEQS